MQGSLSLARGLLWVGRHAKTAEVRAFDLDGRLSFEGFAFRDPHIGRSSVAGLAVDGDRHVWVADEPADRVRVFSVFGREVRSLGTPADAEAAGGPAHGRERHGRERVGTLRAPTDVALRGEDDELEVVVACGGERRHAVSVYDATGTLVASPRPLGDPRARFHQARRVALAGRLLFVVESAGRRVQVFRDREFHFAFELPRRGSLPFEPSALAPLEDGRLVVACGGEESALFLCDAGGRIERRLAGHGVGEGEVLEPSDVALAEGESDRGTRVFVIDRDGERVQVFTLEGRCYGAFEERA